MIYGEINEIMIDGSTFDNATSTGQPSWRDGRAMYFLDASLLCSNTVFRNMTTPSSHSMQSLILHREGHASYDSCEFTDNLVANASRASAMMRIINGATVDVQSCLFQGNTGQSATSVIRNVNSVLDIDASIFESNGKVSTGGSPGLFFRHAVVHTAGLKAKTDLANSAFCGNTVRDTFGPWADLGGNTFAVTCP